MTESSNARPPQVTMAGWVTMVGSVFVLFSLFETVANLRSLESREQVERMLSEPPLEGTGVTFDGWVTFVHAVSLVGAASAVSAGILGFYVLRRHTSARLVLTGLGIPLFFAGFVTSNLLMMLVAVTVTMLWARPSRDWFAGRPWVPQTLPSRGDRSSRSDRRDLEDPSSAQPPKPPPLPWEQPPRQEQPPRPEESGQQPAPPWGQPAATDRPMPPTGDARPHAGFGEVTPRPVVPVGRPAALTTACILTWVCAGMVALFCLLAVLGAALVPEALEDQVSSQELSDAGVTVEEMRRLVLGLGALFGAWALGAVLLAVFAFLGRQGAWVALVVSAGSAAAVLAVAALGSGLAGILLVLPVIACVATVLLMMRPEVRDWVRARGVR